MLEDALRPYVFDNAQLHYISTSIDAHLAQASRMEPNRGVLISGGDGEGKTSILRAIYETLGADTCSFIDCCTDAPHHSFRDTITRISIATPIVHPVVESSSNISCVDEKCRCNKPHIVLLDNLEELPSHDSALLSFTVDNGERDLFYVAAIRADCCHLIDSALLQPYRLNQPIQLTTPSLNQRHNLFSRILSDAGVVFSATSNIMGYDLNTNSSSSTRTESSIHERVSGALAGITQGLSACSILKLARNALLYMESHTFGETTPSSSDVNVVQPTTAYVIDAQDLYQYVSVAYASEKPRKLGDSVEYTVDGCSTGSSGVVVPFLVGVEEAQQRLLRVINAQNLRGSKLSISSSNSRCSSSGSIVLPLASGVLISGPSGSGKTALAYWLARSMQSSFKFISISCADLVHKVVGESERRISDAFAVARRIAPCFILLDNIDTVLGGGGDGEGNTEAGGDSGSSFRGRRTHRTSNKAIDRLLSSLLVEIDGLSSSNEAAADASGGSGFNDELYSSHASTTSVAPPVIVLATCTSPHLIDRSLRRPGRLEEHVILSLPTAAQRERYFAQLLFKYWCSIAEDKEAGGKEGKSTTNSNKYEAIAAKAKTSECSSEDVEKFCKERKVNLSATLLTSYGILPQAVASTEASKARASSSSSSDAAAAATTAARASFFFNPTVQSAAAEPLVPQCTTTEMDIGEVVRLAALRHIHLSTYAAIKSRFQEAALACMQEYISRTMISNRARQQQQQQKDDDDDDADKRQQRLGGTDTQQQQQLIDISNSYANTSTAVDHAKEAGLAVAMTPSEKLQFVCEHLLQWSKASLTYTGSDNKKKMSSTSGGTATGSNTTSSGGIGGSGSGSNRHIRSRRKS